MAVGLCQLCKLAYAVRPPFQHWQMVAGKFRAYSAECHAVLPAAGGGRAHAGTSPFLAVTIALATAAALAVRLFPAALAAFAAGRNVGEVNLLVHALFSMKQ